MSRMVVSAKPRSWKRSSAAARMRRRVSSAFGVGRTRGTRRFSFTPWLRWGYRARAERADAGREVTQESPLAHAREDVKVEEVHPAEDQKDEPDLGAQHLEGGRGV